MLVWRCFVPHSMFSDYTKTSTLVHSCLFLWMAFSVVCCCLYCLLFFCLICHLLYSSPPPWIYRNFLCGRSQFSSNLLCQLICTVDGIASTFQEYAWWKYVVLLWPNLHNVVGSSISGSLSVTSVILPQFTDVHVHDNALLTYQVPRFSSYLTLSCSVPIRL